MTFEYFGKYCESIKNIKHCFHIFHQMFLNLLRELSNVSVKNKIITVSNFSNMLVGAGLCYAIENQTYYNIPFILLFPSIFTGYNMYKNRREICNTLKTNTSFYIPPVH